MKLIRYIVTVSVLVFINTLPLKAQDGKGKDFWITFGQIGDFPPSFPVLSIQIRIVSGNTATTGAIHFTHLGTSAPFSLGANETYTYALDASQREAVYNTTTGITSYSVRVTSFEPVAVYAINFYGGGFGDATNILPETTLDVEYYQISYPSPNENLPQCYAVVATQDNTKLFHNGDSVAMLNEGQVYFKTNTSNMTGAHITANRPVAFFSSHKGTAIPVGATGTAGYLQQQLAPVNTWGKNFFVPLSPTTHDIVRIVALQNSTNITQTGGVIRTDDPQAQTSLFGLQAGQFVDLEIVSNNGCHIKSERPVGICTFLATYASHNSSPSQCWLPALEQRISNAIIAPFFPVTAGQLNQHYALVIVPTDAKNNTEVSIGGAPPTPLFGGSWIDNAGSEMSFYTMPLTHNTASYHFTNPAGFIILCYGSGISASYYYPAGFAMRNLSAAFTANDIPYAKMSEHLFCEHDITFIANVEGIHSNPGSIKWYINGDEHEDARDSLEWSQNFPTGSYEIKMTVLFEDNSTETYEATLTVGCGAAFYANNVDISSVDTTFCAKNVDFSAEIENLSTKPESLKWYIGDEEYLPARDLSEWHKGFENGTHIIKMWARLENGDEVEVFGTLKIQLLWIKMRNVRY